MAFICREAYENSKEEDMESCFCFKYASDVGMLHQNLWIPTTYTSNLRFIRVKWDVMKGEVLLPNL